MRRYILLAALAASAIPRAALSETLLRPPAGTTLSSGHVLYTNGGTGTAGLIVPFVVLAFFVQSPSLGLEVDSGAHANTVIGLPFQIPIAAMLEIPVRLMALFELQWRLGRLEEEVFRMHAGFRTTLLPETKEQSMASPWLLNPFVGGGWAGARETGFWAEVGTRVRLMDSYPVALNVYLRGDRWLTGRVPWSLTLNINVSLF